MSDRYWVATLGCPKNQVDSDKLIGKLQREGMTEAPSPEEASLVVVNTCAFVEAAREESVEAILDLAERASGRVVVTGCMAQRYGDELARELPEVEVVGFGTEFSKPSRRMLDVSAAPLPTFDLLNLPRPRSTDPWAYVKVAEGCDRKCGFCAIPSFRGPQRSRSIESICTEVDQLEIREAVLVAQDLGSFGRDQGHGARRLGELVSRLGPMVDWIRLLYLYPSDLDDQLIDVILSTGVPYFDLSLQHVSRTLLRAMRRPGSGDEFLAKIEMIRSRCPEATFRSNFIVGYPGETEEDHDLLIEFVTSARLDWCGFFQYSEEDGTYAAGLDQKIDDALALERLREVSALQDTITAQARERLLGCEIRVLVDDVGIARGTANAPEIDGIVEVSPSLPVGEFAMVVPHRANGPDLVA